MRCHFADAEWLPSHRICRQTQHGGEGPVALQQASQPGHPPQVRSRPDASRASSGGRLRLHYTTLHSRPEGCLKGASRALHAEAADQPGRHCTAHAHTHAHTHAFLTSAPCALDALLVTLAHPPLSCAARATPRRSTWTASRRARSSSSRARTPTASSSGAAARVKLVLERAPLLAVPLNSGAAGMLLARGCLDASAWMRLLG